MGKFVKETYVNRNVQYPTRYTLDRVAGAGTFSDGDEVDMTFTPGTITAAGTQIVATKLNNTEDQVEEITNGTHNYGASSAGTDTYAITFTTPFTAYNTGMVFNVKADVGNTGAATLNVDTLGAKAIKKFESGGKVDIATGDMITAGFYTLIYDGTDFILMNPNSINQSIATAQGDIIYASAANTFSRLAKGAGLQSLRMNSGVTAPEWGAIVSTGTFSDNSTSIAGSSDYTKSIALGHSATAGVLMFRRYSVSNPEIDGGIIHFDTTDTYSFSYSPNTASSGTDYVFKGNSKLSGDYLSGANDIEIKSVYINGTDLDIIFHNNSGSSITLTVEGRWTIW